MLGPGISLFGLLLWINFLGNSTENMEDLRPKMTNICCSKQGISRHASASVGRRRWTALQCPSAEVLCLTSYELLHRCRAPRWTVQSKDCVGKSLFLTLKIQIPTHLCQLLTLTCFVDEYYLFLVNLEFCWFSHTSCWFSQDRNPDDQSNPQSCSALLLWHLGAAVETHRLGCHDRGMEMRAKNESWICSRVSWLLSPSTIIICKHSSKNISCFQGGRSWHSWRNLFKAGMMVERLPCWSPHRNIMADWWFQHGWIHPSGTLWPRNLRIKQICYLKPPGDL